MQDNRLHTLPSSVGGLQSLHILALCLVQRQELKVIAAEYRQHTVRSNRLSQVAAWPFFVGAGMLIWRGDWAGLYALVPGTLLSFTVAGFNAWVLLIEINR